MSININVIIITGAIVDCSRCFLIGLKLMFDNNFSCDVVIKF